jgi:hypothetical protein
LETILGIRLPTLVVAATLFANPMWLMKSAPPKPQRPDIAIPEEAAGRGPLMSGELRSTHNRHPGMLAQFENIAPHTRKTRIYFFPTVEQAKRLFHASQGPFSFEGTFCRLEDVMETRLAKDIWLKPPSQICDKEAIYWSQTSGQIGSVEIKTRYLPGALLDSRRDHYPAWFVARRCFALQILANHDEEEVAESAKYGFSRPDVFLTLSHGAKASVRRYMKCSHRGVSREITRSGYSITVDDYKDPATAKKDVDALLVLASFASRERTISAHWSHETKEEWNRFWQFNFGKFRKRTDREDPLVRRDRDEYRNFLQRAFEVYSSSRHQALLDSAIYALMDNDQTLETSIARLFSGIQGALVFATQHPLTGNRPPIGTLFRKFTKANPGAFDDLWPLVDKGQGQRLYDLRNAIVHGEAFSEADWLALSYAGEHLRWYLERIILVALGWDIEKSSVSKTALSRFYAHWKWEEERDKLNLRLKNP